MRTCRDQLACRKIVREETRPPPRELPETGTNGAANEQGEAYREGAEDRPRWLLSSWQTSPGPYRVQLAGPK